MTAPEEFTMRQRLVPSLFALILPVAMASSVELTPMKLEPVQPPPPQSSSDRLVDTVIPAYGVRDQSPYRMPSRMTELYQQVSIFTAHVEAEIMGSGLGVGDDRWQVPAGVALPQAARPQLIPAGLLPHQEILIELIALVDEFESNTPLPNHYERWHINNAYRDLYRAGEHLAMGLGDSRFHNLRELHRAWKDYYHRSIQAAIVGKMAQIIETEQAELRRPNLDSALQQALAEELAVPWPTMSLDLEASPYEPVFLPSIPRWSEISEDVRNSFIERFGVPGQPLRQGYPVIDEPEPVEEPLTDDEVGEIVIDEVDIDPEALPVIEEDLEEETADPTTEEALEEPEAMVEEPPVDEWAADDALEDDDAAADEDPAPSTPPPPAPLDIDDLPDLDEF